MRLNPRLKIFIIFVINLLAASFCTLGYLTSQNTLANNGQWISTKAANKFMSLSGAPDYYRSTQALGGGRANLGAWHGFQEIIYRRRISPHEISFDFILSHNSYLNFIFNKDADGFSGLRIGNYSWFDTIYFTARSSGEFIAKQRVEIPVLWDNQRQHIRVVFEKGNTSFFLNNSALESFKVQGQKLQRIGFRGSFNNVSIDNIVVKDEAGKVIFQEGFKNWENFPLVFSVSILGFFLFSILFKLWQRDDWINWLIFNITLLVISGALLYYVQYTFARYIPGIVIWLNAAQREKIKEQGRDFIQEIPAPYAAIPSDRFRIIFIGTSQTKGVGATKLAGTFVNIVEKNLNRMNSRVHYECINAAVPAMRTKTLFELYGSDLSKLHPSLVVMNLSNNDYNMNEFEQYLSKFAVQLQGTPTVFVLEGNSVEVGGWIERKHEVMRKVAATYNIPIIDLHHYLIQKSDTGFLWWDLVHMTPWGQSLAGEYLANEISKLEKSGAFHAQINSPVPNAAQ